MKNIETVVNTVTKTVIKKRQFFQKTKSNSMNINAKNSVDDESGIRFPHAVQIFTMKPKSMISVAGRESKIGYLYMRSGSYSKTDKTTLWRNVAGFSKPQTGTSL